ncbi:30S ribosomal protein S2 [Mycoplasmopsis californica HAZ160_1]|uniref:Small ribosomal subunit protein uS2 n=2 Tax=Mycoplasmopsis californica TaxID=2113 RepID=A0A059XQX9_9BACT|nr:30S ribosomal protein S2 [Mycoplasmopsis californica]AIA29455.1 30S ribosomal protein S2 [Mycoplasmopsis californica]BAP01095.1 30S ribosomal protein S2 [Mycoplasmopsis californica HAZ160_1]BBG40961.1 30S ribosomal protein S2 [Mycoplasmopsis californica]BBG41555.1 30S ribosomal protein S2 [Mycoplasmopsis californica]BBG42148.1 30S ribosomal protein S2 [Mycoplasmopsis californica]
MTDTVEKKEVVANEATTKKVDEKAKEVKTSIVSKEKLLEAGAYFGHRASQWNPKMKDYLYPQLKRGIHIINTAVTTQRLEFAYNLINKFVAKNPRAQFIFVGTKKQAKETIKENAIRTGSFYVVDRWLGGTLTNSSTIFKRVSAMEELEEKAANNFEGYGYVKKEKLDLQKKLDKLHKNLDGIRNMRGLPTFMIVADPNEDEIAVKEARKKGVKVIGILDSNSNPDAVDFGIPANDDSAKSINLIITILADAIVTARGGKAKYAYRPDAEIELPKYEPDPKTIIKRERRGFFKRGDMSAETTETATTTSEKGE